jgi:hypothetical protein
MYIINDIDSQCLILGCAGYKLVDLEEEKLCDYYQSLHKILQLFYVEWCNILLFKKQKAMDIIPTDGLSINRS